MSFNFTDALDQPMESAERPPLVPAGTYKGTVTKHPSTELIADGRWEVCDFMIRLTEPTDTVNTEELQAYGGLGPQATMRRRFMFNKEDSPEADAANKRTMFDLRNFLENHLRCATSKTPFRKALADAQNATCYVSVRHKQRKDQPELMEAEIGKTMPIE